MLMVFKGLESNKIITFDVEFDNQVLLSFSAFKFKRLENDIYELDSSCTYYHKVDKINKFAEKYTGITLDFLQEYGLESKEINKMLGRFIKKDCLLVSHGVNQDMKVLSRIGFQTAAKRLCTHNLARSVLNKDCGYKLSDLVKDAGMQTFNAHDSYADAFFTAVVFSYLLNAREGIHNEDAQFKNKKNRKGL